MKIARTWRYVLAFCLTTLTSTFPSFGQDLPTDKPEDVGVSSAKVAALSKFMQSLVDDGKIAGGVTMMARHGKVIHLKAVGMADREEKEPMQTDSIFRIASMTKPITSVAVMMLVEEGKLGLDDPVSKFIPEFKNPQVLVSVKPWKTEPAKREITIRHLLTHTSGLGYSFTPQVAALHDESNILTGVATSSEPVKETIRRLVKIPLIFEPGSSWNYGMSIDVLGRVVEIVSGKSLGRYFEEEIFRPLEMKDTHFRLPPEKSSRLVAAYVPVDTCLRKVQPGERLKEKMVRDNEGFIGTMTISSDYPDSPSNVAESGGAGLSSTASDYMRFCQMLLNGGELNGKRVLNSDTVARMTSNQIGDLCVGTTDAKFGFGFAILPDQPTVHPQLRNSYAWGGYWCTSFRVSPSGQWILITMAQVAGRPTEPDYERIAAEAIVK